MRLSCSDAALSEPAIRRAENCAEHGTASTPVYVLHSSVFNCGQRHAQMNTWKRGSESGIASIPSEFSKFLLLRLWPPACHPISVRGKRQEYATQAANRLSHCTSPFQGGFL